MFRALVILLLLAGCSTIQPVAQSTTTTAVCQVVDKGSTIYGIRAGLLHEANPIMAPIFAHGLLPPIIVGYSIWRLVKWANDPVATETVNAVTCGVAVHNLWLLH